MTVREQLVLEERAARARQRGLERAQRMAAKVRDRAWHERLRNAIRDTRSPRCRCALHPGMTRDDLRALGGGCTDPAYVCPRLDTIRRRVGA